MSSLAECPVVVHVIDLCLPHGQVMALLLAVLDQRRQRRRDFKEGTAAGGQHGRLPDAKTFRCIESRWICSGVVGRSCTPANSAALIWSGERFIGPSGT